MKQLGVYSTLCSCDILKFCVVYVAEREEGRLKNEIQRLDNEIADWKEKMNTYEVATAVAYFNSMTGN